MKYYSTNNRALRSTLREAILLGLAPDNGLFMPERIPVLNAAFWQGGKRELQDTAFGLLNAFFGEDIPEENLQGIIGRTYNFPAPVTQVLPGVNVLEL
jgi:threonine synthase